MRIWGISLAAILAAAGTASAQNPFVYKPIDTSRYVVGPTDAVANAAGGTATGTLRTIGRAVAGTIEDNGFVRTINNLFGRRASNPSVQAGFSPLPLPSAYASTRYPSAFTPSMPLASTYGRTPNLPLPRGTIVGR